MLNEKLSMLSLPSTQRKKQNVLILVAICLILFCLALLFSNRQLPVIQPFLPAYISLVSFIELTTAYILWNQYKETSEFPLYLLTLTYFFSSLVVIPHLLTFPGVFSDHGLLGAGTQTAVYFWSLWHGVYPIGFILYFLSQYKKRDKQSIRVRETFVLFGFLFIIGIITGFLALTTKYHHVLPLIIEKGDYSGLFTSSIGPTIIIINVIAVFLALFKEDKSIMDMLILLTSLTFCLDTLLTISASARYTVGWYIARIISLGSSSIVLLAFTRELTQLNRKMKTANQQLERQFLKIRQQKEKIEQSKDKYQLVVDSIHEIILQLNSTGQVVYANRYWKELFGKDIPSYPFSLLEFIHQDDQKIYIGLQESIHTSNDGNHEQELRFRTYDNRVIWLNLSIIPIKDQNGFVLGAFGTIRELSEQMKRREIEKYRVLGQLTTAICHEIRNPITSIRGFIQLMNEDKQIEKKEYFPIILNELDKTEKTLVDYLQFSKPTVDNHNFISIDKLINTCINVIYPFALSNNVLILGQINEGIFIKADQGKLEKALVNVMLNGVEAMQNGGELLVTAERNQHYLQIVVQDFGEGMSGEEIKKVGEPTYTLKNKGTGFGMMITKQYILAMGGDISIESKKNYGTKVTITFPVINSIVEETLI